MGMSIGFLMVTMHGCSTWLNQWMKKLGDVQLCCHGECFFEEEEEGPEIRKQLVESDKLECIITLASGVFTQRVSRLILFLNNKKKNDHKGRICMIDASKHLLHKRAQNIMTDEDNVTKYSSCTLTIKM